jgi:Uma2 family endonuclease
MSLAVERVRTRISVDRYQKMVATGVLTRDDRVELIEGDILDVAPIGSRHAAVSVRLTKLFVRGVKDAAEVSVGGPIDLGKFSEPQPDLSLLRPRADYSTRIPQSSDALLVVEIADSTLVYDRTTKLALYARYGIEEYWIVDVAGERIEMYRGPMASGYAERLEVSGMAVASPRALPDLRIEVRALF